MQEHFEMAVKVIQERIGLDQQRVSERVAEVLGLIGANLFDPKFKASSLKATKATRRAFHETFDATPSRYIRVRRVEVALFLLDYTEGTIPEIAKMVGYPNVFSFNHTFKQLMDRSPSAEREHWRSQNRDKVEGKLASDSGRLILNNPRIWEAPIDRKAQVAALPPRFAAFHLCLLRYRAGDVVGELDWLDRPMEEYMKSVEGDGRRQPPVPELSTKTETLSADEETALLEQAARPSLDVLDTLETDVPRGLRSMLENLRANVTTPEYRLDQLRDEVGAYHADRSEFSRFMGVTPWQYLFEVRMETVARLLRDTPLSVTVIAQLVGYADAPQFRRMFKNWSGELSPDEYRTRVRVTAARVGPAPARFTNWRWLEHVRRETSKEVLELVRYVERVYGFTQ